MKLHNIPTEVIIYNIFPKVGVESTVLLTKVSKEFHKNKKNIHSYLVNNDIFILSFTKFHKMNLIRTLSQSSVSYKLFDDMYDYIKYDKEVEFTNDGCDIITAENTKQYQINNTFIIFKMLKSSANHNIHNADKKVVELRRRKSSYVVVNLMKKYFISMYFARNGSKFYTSFMDNINICWERSNINLYNVCENLNLICSDKESDTEALRENLKNFSDTIVNRNGHHTSDTSVIIHKIFVSYFQPKKVLIYANYVIFRYLNNLFDDNIYTRIITNPKFIESSMNMLSTYEYVVNNTYSVFVEPYFKDLIMKEITEYKINIANNC